jgi:hypothetical protein
MIVHEETWAIESLVVDMGSWRHGHKILLPPSMVREISWSHREVAVDASRSEIASLPAFDPAAPVNVEVKEHHYDYYGRPRD